MTSLSPRLYNRRLGSCKEDARAWRYSDLRQIKIESPTSIELVSYEDQKRMFGRDRVFKFKAIEGGASQRTLPFSIETSHITFKVSWQSPDD